MSEIGRLDQECVWHPFTQMREWNDPAHEPLVLVRGEGAWLEDGQGRRYLDGNSSIWTNLHGHRHPKLDAAVRAQLDRVAHTSFLGLTNDRAPLLARRLLEAARMRAGSRVFFSDDGSTAMEAALKMAHQARMQRGERERTRFVSLSNAYHGDTVGAMSAGHSALFHRVYKPMLFETAEVMSPACYRCPFNRARPERGVDAREARSCAWECVRELEKGFDGAGAAASALVMEPRVQGAAGMTMHPHGYLERAAALCRARGAWLVLDEVMTGFGRTGAMFAWQHEGVEPDLVGLAKGLTGGYLPLAATLAGPEIFEAFLGEHADNKTFFHGHSYTGNALGCAAALASLDVLESEHTLEHIRARAARLRKLGARFWDHPNTGDVRQEGMVLAVELVEEFTARRPFPMEARAGIRVCDAARRHGLLTRAVGNVLVLMPPYCASDAELDRMVEALCLGMREAL